jgi:hypothetical protein
MMSMSIDQHSIGKGMSQHIQDNTHLHFQESEAKSGQSHGKRGKMSRLL